MVGLLVSSFLIIPLEVGASFGFGGRVTGMQACQCSGGYQVTIQGPGQSSGTYLQSPASRAYKTGFLSNGRNVLGVYNSGGTCITAPPYCEEELPITKGTISFFGVSFGFSFSGL